MSFLVVMGLIGFVLGVILLLPPMQKRAMERQVKAPLLFPVVVCAIGAGAFVVGTISLPG